eukprot:13094936-Alexandrium_andersonii.AAC.1
MTRVDHVPSVVSITIPISRAPRWHARKKLACDLESLKDPHVLDRVAGELVTAPVVPWEVDVDTHVAL